MKSYLLIAILSFPLGLGQIHANNIQVSNTTLSGQDITAGADNAANFAMIQFDLSWENAWRTAAPANWDAAWVYAKFRFGSVDYLSAPGASNTGTTITVNSTNGLRIGMPVFVHSGTGTFASGTVITSINAGNNTFTVSASLTTPLSNNAVVRAERIWEHCWLNSSGHDKGSLAGSASLQVGLQNEALAFNASTNPALGAFFYFSGNSTGTFSTIGAKLRWNYAAQGIRDQDIVDVKVFAVEMVNVPTGGFEIDTALYYANTALLINGDGSNGAQNNTFLDGSTNNFALTANGDVYQGGFSPYCGLGGSAYFDGTGDYISPPQVTEFKIGTSDFTVECWVYPTSLTNYNMIFGFSGENIYWALRSGGSIQFYGGGLFETSAGLVPLNQWTHIAVSRQGSSLRQFVNGVLVLTSNNSTNLASSATDIWFGASATYPNQHFFIGYMSDLRFTNGTAIYTSNFSIPTGPISSVANTELLLHFQNAAILDEMYITNFSSVGNAQISTTQSKNGGSSIYLDGTGDYLSAINPSSNLISWHSQDFTLEAWVYLTANPQNSFYGGSSLISNSALSGQSEYWSFGPLANRTVRFYYFNGSQTSFTTATALNLNQWHHLAFVRKGTSMTIFIDGVSSATATISGTPQSSSTIRFNIGQTIGAFFAGYIDDLRILAGTALYSANFTPPSGPHSIGGAPDYFVINSENQLTLGGATPDLSYSIPSVSTADDFDPSNSQTLSFSFPKGYNGFYMMKYEISQHQWMEFFNCLSSIQKTSRDITDANGKNSDAITHRNNLNWTSGAATLNSNTHGSVACNYLSWMDGLAFTDWAGLRPMSEFEYEKACRGTASAQSGEAATAEVCNLSANMTQTTGISNNGGANETPTNSLANAAFGNHASVQGPLRVGAFASASSLRGTAGASFYGIMELNGNLWEQVVTIGNSDGRNFTPVHGNGELTSAGHADVSAWPGYVTSANTGATGSGRRGGSWEDNSNRMRVSDRFQANSAVSTRNRANGFRSIRSLPSTSAQ